MIQIFVNLKRFEVPKAQGGICPLEDPHLWIRSIIQEAATMELAAASELQLVYLLPEGLITPAWEAWKDVVPKARQSLSIGCQGVHWQDISKGGNFGAFTSLLPAKAAKNLGCSWAMIGHSEERRAKLDLLMMYDSDIESQSEVTYRARMVVNRAIGQEVQCALQAGLNVLLCVGETEQEKGPGSFEEQKQRIRVVLREQLSVNLSFLRDVSGQTGIVIGYEPIWAIGPGKTPPGSEHIGFVSAYIKEAVRVSFGFTPAVVYGGGLKEENAGLIAAIETIDGGLVALTRFTGEIGYEPEGFKRIIERYLESTSGL